jgi:hypothetical protein
MKDINRKHRPHMTSYNNFDQILNDPQVDEQARIQFTRKWLNQQYGITAYDTDWVNVLTAVHDHDNLPKHFGQPRVGSAFAALVTQLAKLPDGWHLAYIDANDEMTPVHPKTETSYSHPENIKRRSRITTVLKTGKLLAPANNQQTSRTPDSFPGTITDIYAEKDQAVKVDDELNPTITPTTQVATKSVSIDLSSF